MPDVDIQFLIDKFNEIYSSKENNFSLFFAPGRINLIGEHTDYTGGLIFAAGINKGTYILARKNKSSVIKVASLNFNGIIESIDLNNELQKENKWTDYIKGILHELRLAGGEFRQGFDCVIFGNIPDSAGLSSSASLEMVCIMTFLGMNNKFIPTHGRKEMIDYTLLAQRCENNFVGVNCGIMDQFVVGNAKKNSAIRLDCFDLSFDYCKIDLGDYRLLIANTNKKRRLVESQYNKRREECEFGFRLLKNMGLNHRVLGKVPLKNWMALKNNLSNNPIIKKRLEHVITENNRVCLSFDFIKKNDIINFAKLINKSGDSLRYNYEVTGLHLDALVDAARTTTGVIASRMIGAGFGGCTINIVRADLINRIKKEIELKYLRKTKNKPDFYVFELGEGERQLEI